MEVIRGGQGDFVKYVVKLSAEEREQLEAMICAGKHPAQSLTKMWYKVAQSGQYS